MTNKYNEELNKNLEELLKNLKCKNCKHLEYYDFYFCSIDKHNDDNGFLNINPLPICPYYEKAEWEKFWTE